jgi:hypothetical protein
MFDFCDMKLAFHKFHFYVTIRVVGFVNLGCLSPISFYFSSFITCLLCVLLPSEVEPDVPKLFTYLYIFYCVEHARLEFATTAVFSVTYRNPH